MLIVLRVLSPIVGLQTKFQNRFNIRLSSIADSRFFFVGELFRSTQGGIEVQTTNKTVLIPRYKFQADGKLAGWRICSESSGYVSLQVIIF